MNKQPVQVTNVGFIILAMKVINSYSKTHKAIAVLNSWAVEDYWVSQPVITVPWSNK